MRTDVGAWLQGVWKLLRLRPVEHTASLIVDADDACIRLDPGPDRAWGLCSLSGVLDGPRFQVIRPRLRFRGNGPRERDAICEWMALGQVPFEVSFLIPPACRSIEWEADESWGRNITGPLVMDVLGRDATLLHFVKRPLSPLRRWVAQKRRDLRRRWATPRGDGVTRDLGGYRRYIAQTEIPPEVIRRDIADHISRMKAHTKFALFLFIDSEDLASIHRTVASVRGQFWPRWTLNLVVDRARWESIGKLAEDDPRIRIHGADGLKDLSSDTADASDADFLCRLGCGDVLHVTALYMLASEVELHPGCELLYCDEDSMDGRGTRTAPVLKSGWNRELLHAGHYLGKLAAFRRDRVIERGGWRADAGGVADYDLALRFTRDISAANVRHVPAILYHRDSRAARGVDPALLASALRAHLEGTGATVEAMSAQRGLRTWLPLPQPAPLVSVIVPTRDGFHHLKTCIDSLYERTDYPDFELLLVDNQSVDPATLDYLAEVGQRRGTRILRYDASFNFAAIINFAEAQASGTFLALLNDDTEILFPGWLTEMVSIACQADVGAVGAKLYYPDGTIQHGGLGLGIGSVAGHLHLGAPGTAEGYLGRLRLTQAVGAVTGACLVVDRAKFQQIGGMDAANLRVAFNDVDFCLKLAEQGWHSVWTPFAELVHHESRTRGTDSTPIKRALFQQEHLYMRMRWGHVLQADSYYHPHLTRSALDLGFHRMPKPCRPWLADDHNRAIATPASHQKSAPA